MQQFVHYSHIVYFSLASLLRRLQPKIFFVCVNWVVVCYGDIPQYKQ